MTFSVPANQVLDLLCGWVAFLVVATDIADVSQALDEAPLGKVVDLRLLERIVEVGNLSFFAEGDFVVGNDPLQMPLQHHPGTTPAERRCFA